MWNILKDTTVNDADTYMTLKMMSEILGLGIEITEEEKASIPQEVLELLDRRKIARESKDFTQCDILRDEIRKHGFTVKDTPEGHQITAISQKYAGM